VNYRFLSPAQKDLAEAVAFYEQAAPGLGLEFLDEIERTVRRIQLQPEAWARVTDRHRRCRTRRFPFGLIYSIDQDMILIAAVMNLRRHPDSWKKQ
jgi:plasmid stabilization system protein ParE